MMNKSKVVTNYTIKTIGSSKECSNNGGAKDMSPQTMTVMDLGKLLLHYTQTGETAKVQELMTRGAPFTTDWLGTSPLHFAALHNHKDICETLIRAGICKDARTKVNRTPLHLAVFEGNEEIVQILLNKKCDVNAQDMLNMTPLHWAVDRNHKRIAKMLLDFGADPTVSSKFGKTPMSIALSRNQLDLVTKMQQARETLGDNQNIHPNDYEDNSMGELHEISDDSKGEQKILNYMIKDKSDTISLKSEKSESQSWKSVHKLPKSTSISLENISTPSSSTMKSKRMSSLEMLKDIHNSSMKQDQIDNLDSSLITSALQSGRKIVLSDAGKLALNETRFKDNTSAIRRKTTGESRPVVLKVVRKDDMKMFKGNNTVPRLKQVATNQLSSSGAKQLQYRSAATKRFSADLPINNKVRKMSFDDLEDEGEEEKVDSSSKSLEEQMIELKREHEKLRVKLEKSEQLNEEYRIRLEKLEQNVNKD